VTETNICTDFSEIEKRANYSRDNLISVESFESLIWQYRFPDNVHCQVERDGCKCNQEHKHGWLGRRQDGKEAIIGQVCGTKYFKASDVFQRERRRIDSELNIASHLAALGELVRDKSALMARGNAANQSIKELRESARGFQKLFTQDVKRRVSDILKTGNRRVFVEMHVIEKDDDGKEKHTWREREIGTLQGVDLWDDRKISNLFKELSEVKATIGEVDLLRAPKEKTLKQWRNTIELLPRCEELIADLRKALTAFTATPNIALLSVIGRSQINRNELCEQVLTGAGDPTPSSRKVNALAAELAAWVKQQTGGVDYRGV